MWLLLLQRMSTLFAISVMHFDRVYSKPLKIRKKVNFEFVFDFKQTGWCRFGLLIVKFKHGLHLSIVFVLLTFSR